MGVVNIEPLEQGGRVIVLGHTRGNGPQKQMGRNNHLGGGVVGGREGKGSGGRNKNTGPGTRRHRHAHPPTQACPTHPPPSRSQPPSRPCLPPDPGSAPKSSFLTNKKQAGWGLG